MEIFNFVTSKVSGQGKGMNKKLTTHICKLTNKDPDLSHLNDDY